MARPSLSLGPIAVAMLILVLTSCGGAKESAEQRAACEGPRLRDVQAREKALQDGYEINRRYDCIDKASFAAVANARAKWEAANTMEAKAQAATERAERTAAEKAQAVATAPSGDKSVNKLPVNLAPLRPVDVNTATMDELAEVIGVGGKTAAAIVEERTKGSFKGWPDLVHRVVGISAARNAFLASTGGLTVNGESLQGAPADPGVTAVFKETGKIGVKDPRMVAPQ